MTATTRSRVLATYSLLATRPGRSVENHRHWPWADRSLSAACILISFGLIGLWLSADSPRTLMGILIGGGWLFLYGADRRLRRWIWGENMKGKQIRVTKSEIDNLRQLLNLLTTAGGFSLLAKASPLVYLLLLADVILGITIFNAVRPLTAEEVVENSVTYSLVNSAHLNALRRLVGWQIWFAATALVVAIAVAVGQVK